MVPRQQSYNSVYMMFEKMDTDLATVIRSSTPLSEAHVQFFIYQTLRALKYLHSADIIHRDVVS